MIERSTRKCVSLNGTCIVTPWYGRTMDQFLGSQCPSPTYAAIQAGRLNCCCQLQYRNRCCFSRDWYAPCAFHVSSRTKQRTIVAGSVRQLLLSSFLQIELTNHDHGFAFHSDVGQALNATSKSATPVFKHGWR